jgi:hypothetical protein
MLTSSAERRHRPTEQTDEHDKDEEGPGRGSEARRCQQAHFFDRCPPQRSLGFSDRRFQADNFIVVSG